MHSKITKILLKAKDLNLKLAFWSFHNSFWVIIKSAQGQFNNWINKIKKKKRTGTCEAPEGRVGDAYTLQMARVESQGLQKCQSTMLL
jgi:hypothetical protein